MSCFWLTNKNYYGQRRCRCAGAHIAKILMLVRVCKILVVQYLILKSRSLKARPQIQHNYNYISFLGYYVNKMMKNSVKRMSIYYIECLGTDMGF